MDYLSRNELLVAEIAKLSNLARGKIIGESKKGTIVRTIGSYHSEFLEKEVYLALKVHPRYQDSKVMVFAMILNYLGLMQTISSKKPDLFPELSVVYAVLNVQNQPVGTLTEDFSMGGNHEVHDISEFDKKNIPRELAEIVRMPIDDYELAKVGFLVEGKRRLGDFDTLIAGLHPRDIQKKFNLGKILEKMHLHTVNLEYTL